jgi:hypothetical protein
MTFFLKQYTILTFGLLYLQLQQAFFFLGDKVKEGLSQEKNYFTRRENPNLSAHASVYYNQRT